MSVLRYTTEASHLGYFWGRSTGLIHLSSKTNPKESNTGTVVEKSQFLQLELFSKLFTMMPKTSAHDKTQRRRVNQARWGTRHKSLRIHGNEHPFPHHRSSSLSSPHLYGNGPHFTSSSPPKQGVECLVTHLELPHPSLYSPCTHCPISFHLPQIHLKSPFTVIWNSF